MTALDLIRDALRGTEYEDDVYEVGGVVRDALLGRPLESPTWTSSRAATPPPSRVCSGPGGSPTTPPVTYERFGTAMLTVAETQIEFVTARKESYDEGSRKPNVEPATYEEDAARRDFTTNALYRSLFTGEITDPTRHGGSTTCGRRSSAPPSNPARPSPDDPLRMLRAVRFRHRLGFVYAPGLADAIRANASRLAIVSAERVRDELLKILMGPDAPAALEEPAHPGPPPRDCPRTDGAMKGVDQGSFHHLDVWGHTLLALERLGEAPVELRLAVLFHDVGKPPTREIRDGKIRFFSHEAVGADTTRAVLGRWKLSNAVIERVARLVKNHMRLGTSPEFTPAAARRLARDLGEDTEGLLRVVEADASALRPGVRALDLAPIRARLAEVAQAAPEAGYRSPLSGAEIMALAGLAPGPEVGRLKALLEEAVMEGTLAPDDRAEAERRVLAAR